MFRGEADFKLHHVGCAVESIESALKTYRDLLGFTNISKVYRLVEMNINVCFVELSGGVFLELIEPSGESSVINSYRKKGITYYHLGYKVRNADKVAAELVAKDFKEITSLYSPAFDNRKCIFLYTPELQMIELIDSD